MWTTMNLLLLAAVGYAAVTMLVGLMRTRRGQVLEQLEEQVERERKRQRALARQTREAAQKSQASETR